MLTWEYLQRCFPSLAASNNSATFRNLNVPLNASHWCRTEPLVTTRRLTCQLSQKRAATTSEGKLNTIIRELNLQGISCLFGHSARWSLEFTLSPFFLWWLFTARRKSLGQRPAPHRWPASGQHLRSPKSPWQVLNHLEASSFTLRGHSEEEGVMKGKWYNGGMKDRGYIWGGRNKTEE